MSVYDKAHELAKELKMSNEYKSFLAVKDSVEQDQPVKKMVQEFILKQMEIQYDLMSGKEDQSKSEQLKKMYELISYNGKAKEFLDSHLRFQQMMTDIYKIIGESVAEGMDFFVKE